MTEMFKVMKTDRNGRRIVIITVIMTGMTEILIGLSEIITGVTEQMIGRTKIINITLENTEIMFRILELSGKMTGMTKIITRVCNILMDRIINEMTN